MYRYLSPKAGRAAISVQRRQLPDALFSSDVPAAAGGYLFAPYGYAAFPVGEQQLLMLESQGSDLCAGMLQSADTLQPGEIRIAAASGGYLQLCCDGSVVINGLTITADGQLIPAGQKEV